MKAFWLLVASFSAFVLLTRLPYEGHQLYNYDDVNFAYSIGQFDISKSQPQAPGYPLFVLELRALRLAGFKRPESILLAIRMIGSVASMVALAYFGTRLAGGWAGVWAAVLLAVHPVFWFSGLTSGVRLQLALVSVVVAGLCYECWREKSRWTIPSAIGLGLGAGIRPELGVVLLPLWIFGVLRAEAEWRRRSVAVGVLAAAVLAWLIPTTLLHGGLAKYIRLNWAYFTTQAGGMTSVLFGAEQRKWETALTWLVVWTFCTVPALAIPAALSWRRREPGLSRMQWAFLATWLIPGFAFSALVHVGDPGHALGVIPVVCLVGGYWISRGVNQFATDMPHLWFAVAMAMGASCVYFAAQQHPDYALPALCAMWVIAALAPLWSKVWIPHWFVRAQASALVLAPVVFLSGLIFFKPSWYHPATPSSGLAAEADLVWQNLYSGLSATSLAQMRAVIDNDDHAVRELRTLLAERPGETVFAWEEGLSEWRKIAYYFPDVPIFVLEPNGITRIWRGPREEKRIEPGVAIELPAGHRVAWLINPRTAFYGELNQALPMVAPNLVYHTDLSYSGTARAGRFLLKWESVSEIERAAAVMQRKFPGPSAPQPITHTPPLRLPQSGSPPAW